MFFANVSARRGGLTSSGVSQTADDEKVVFSREKGFASVACITGRVNAAPTQLYNFLVDPDYPPRLRLVKERTRYELLKEDPPDRKLFAAEYSANWKFLTYSGEMKMDFHIEQDKRDKWVVMKLVKPGFLKKFEMKFQIHPDENPGCSFVMIEEKLLPSLPSFDPFSKSIVRGINRRQVEDTLEDVRLHVEACKNRQGSSWFYGLQ